MADVDWWHWLIGSAWAVLMWVRLRRARKVDDTRLLAGSTRELGGRGGF